MIADLTSPDGGVSLTWASIDNSDRHDDVCDVIGTAIVVVEGPIVLYNIPYTKFLENPRAIQNVYVGKNKINSVAIHKVYKKTENIDAVRSAVAHTKAR